MALRHPTGLIATLVGAKPQASIIIVVYGGGWQWLPRALSALRRETRQSCEVILVDNGPPERVPQALRSDPAGTTVIRNRKNVGFGQGCNQGAALARAPTLCFLNPDVFVRSNWLPPLLEVLGDLVAGAAVPQKLNLDGALDEAGAFVDCHGNTCVFGSGDDPQLTEHRFRRNVDYGSASCLCIRREVFEELDGFDAAFGLAYFEDADLCFRLRERGLSTVYEPRSQVVHVRTTAVPLEEAFRIGSRSRQIFFERWRDRLQGRPTCVDVHADPTAALAARDLHATDRLLALNLPETARKHALADPRARVTFATDSKLTPAERDSLLAAGVEVAEEQDWPTWFDTRRAHYSRLYTNNREEPGALEALALEANPQAVVMRIGSEPKRLATPEPSDRFGPRLV